MFPSDVLEKSLDWSTALKKFFLKMYLKIAAVLDHKAAPDLVEYALIITLVSMAAAGHVYNVSREVDSLFTNISNTLAQLN
jgi:Flp pilus assembly pilin Flp